MEANGSVMREKRVKDDGNGKVKLKGVIGKGRRGRERSKKGGKRWERKEK